MTRILLLAALFLSAAQDDVQVSASLDRQTAEVGETVILTITLRAATLRSPEIDEPSLTGFEVIASSDRSSFRFSTAAGSIREFSRQYTLRVGTAGQLTISPFRISVDGILYETVTLQLTAAEPSAMTRLPGSLEPEAGEEVVVRLWVEPETAYVGQQVTMTVAAFFDPLVRNRLQRQPEYRPPDVHGFWIADLPGPIRPERQDVGGRTYFVQIYRRALFPLSTGRVQIPAAAVIYEVRRGLIYAPETFHVESSPVVVTILPTPEEGKPSDYAGAVGSYEATAYFDRSEVAAGEAINLVLEVRGSGNLRALPRPELPAVAGIRVYEGTEESEIEFRGTEFAGHKRFSWVLIPERAGQYVIPELVLPYFDPALASYRGARTEPMTLNVQRTPALSIAAATSAGSALRFVKDEPAGEPLNLHYNTQFWVLLAVPLTLLLGVQIASRYRQQATPRRPRRRQRGRQALRALRPLAKSADASFFVELRAAILGYLQSRLRQPALTTQGIVQTQHALEDAGVPPQVTLDLIGVVEKCARHRYSPDPPGTRERVQLLERAEKLLVAVDKEAVSERRLQTVVENGGALSLMVAGLLVASPLAVQAQGADSADEVDHLLGQGVSAYARGDYASAVDYFERALQLEPHDAHIQYNLGNAHYELGEQGWAVAMWMNSLRLEPRDGDARFNLLLAVGDDPVLGSSLPPVPLSDDELAIMLAALWFVGCLALIARQRWQNVYLTMGGWSALGLALITATVLLIPRADYAVVVSQEAALRAGPVTQSEPLGFPAAGTGFRVKERREGWLRVTRGGESEGWIDEREVAVIGQRAVLARGG